MNTQVNMTENGDKAYATSGDFCLDLFTRITRNALFSDYIDTFAKAWSEDKETSIQILMNMRDIRNGKGEKLIPSVLLVYLKFIIESDVYEAILRKMVEYGYWKDLLRIIEIETRALLESNKKSLISKSPIEVKLFAEQLKKDFQIISDAESTDNSSTKKVAISLCSKWAPSEKTHFDHHPIFAATNIMNEMGLDPKQYRVMLTKLRSHLSILETLMSTQRFDEIDFSKLPSIAHMKTKKAFLRDTNADGVESDERKKLHKSYEDYLKDLSLGKTKVNVKGIQPHELVGTYMHSRHTSAEDIDYLVEGQWEALKNRITESGVFRDVTAIVDVSSSMSGQPMEVAIALGILVAECTKGPFNGKVITFQEKPSWHHLNGLTLKDKVDCLQRAPWGGSTNLRAVFEMLLNEAVAGELTSDEMVKTLFIFTDMQFNACDRGSWESTFEYAKKIFSDAGYTLPRIVCWNLRTSDSKSMPVTKDEEGFAMLSGFSAELLKCVLGAEQFTPYLMMKHVLEPYNVPEIINTSVHSNLVTDLLVRDSLEKAVTKSAIKKAFKTSNKTTNTSNTSFKPVFRSGSGARGSRRRSLNL